jgi:CheY-like chemotaxis protein
MGTQGVTEPDCRHVLIVEDDQDDAFLLKRALSSAAAERKINLRFVHRVNGMDALGAVARDDMLNAMPQVIVVDLNMPLVDGGRFLQVLRNDFDLCHVPTVVLTTATEKYVHDKAMAEGADAVFSKPNGQDELLAIARKILAFSGAPRPAAAL